MAIKGCQFLHAVHIIKQQALGGVCMRRNAEKYPVNRLIGIALIALGAIVLLFCVPEWLWMWLIGLALIAAGFLFWKGC